jgi:putative nucleotidyltransferase with HDIG domain
MAILMATLELILCGLAASRRESLLRGLKAIRIPVRPVAISGPDEISEASRSDVALVLAEASGPEDPALRLLLGLKRSRPGLSLLIVLPGAEGALEARLLRDGRADAVIGPGCEAGLLSLLLSEWRRLKSQSLSEARAKALRKAQADQARSLRRSGELEEIYDSTLENLMTALDLRDVETFGHSQTVAKYTQVLATLIGLNEAFELDYLRRGALLHDIGKIAIPDAILKKPGPLTPAEWEKVRLHPALGHGLIKEIKMVQMVGNVILHHHERFDGTGYPHGLKGDRIPLEARLFALADALDAITAHRPYRRARDFRYAQREIARHSGTQFDPRLVDAFLRVKPEKWEKIRFETTSFIPSIEDFSALARRLKS